MTDTEIMDALRGDSLLEKVRRVFSSGAARIEQANAQRHPLTPIEWRRMEYEEAKKIAAVLGVSVD